jgi:RNA methyltransferase, TrmH family
MITSLQHPLVKHFVKLRTDRAYRQLQQKVIIEGLKPILELQSFVTQLLYTPAFANYAQIIQPTSEVTEGIMQKISGMTAPEGIIAEVQMPAFISLTSCPSILVFDGVSDPGNLGTLLRTALALGWEGAYFLPEGCDPFNEKVLRAARGAHFKLKLGQGTVKTLQNLVQDQKRQAWVADIQGEDVGYIQATKPCVLVVGNEAHGASQAVKKFCAPVTIPMSGQMESLNVAVAGGILLYTLGKERSDR